MRGLVSHATGQVGAQVGLWHARPYGDMVLAGP